MEVLFKIGEAAAMFGVSIRALRLYNKMGLFRPEYIDPETGYRYYTADQMPVLNTILVLKGIGVRLAEIKQLVDSDIRPELLTKILSKRQEYWENQIEIAKFNIENIESIRSSAQSVINGCKSADTAVPNAYKMSRLVCLENIKVEHFLSEVLWL